MRVHIGSDHAGLELKNALVEHLKNSGHDVVDHGPHVYDALDDYPVFCIPALIVSIKGEGMDIVPNLSSRRIIKGLNL